MYLRVYLSLAPVFDVCVVQHDSMARILRIICMDCGNGKQAETSRPARSRSALGARGGELSGRAQGGSRYTQGRSRPFWLFFAHLGVRGGVV